MAFLDLFQSNAPPSPQDRLFVQTKLHSLELEIVELETTLQDLQTRHTQLLSERQRHRCVLAPIRRLPAELVGEIFSYFTPRLPSDFELRIRNRDSRMLSRPPWFLAHICSSWRTIALSLGPLWATFDANLADSRLPHSGHTWMLESQRAEVDQAVFYEGGAAIQLAMDEMEMYLRLSGNTSIKVLLNVGRFAALPVLRFLLRHSWKLGELVLYHPCWLLLHHLKNMQQSYPRLRRLAIVPNYEEGIDDLQSTFSWAQAPNLKELFIFGDVLFVERGVPWAQLTSFTHSGMVLRDGVLDCISHRLVHLTELKINCSSFCQLDSSQIGTIELPCLRVAAFSLRSASYRRHTFLSRIFRMPALEAFALHVRQLFSLADGIPFEAQGLRILRLTAPGVGLDGFEPNTTGKILREFPKLEELSLQVLGVFSETTLADLTPRRDSTELPLLPELRTLRLSGDALGDDLCRWTTLVDMLKARLDPRPDLRALGLKPLRIFEFTPPVTYAHEIDMNVVAGLRALARKRRWDIRAHDDCRVPDWDEIGLHDLR
ncbi:hypothetical protein HMN09_00176900 [Mycena chlorophos]|uniref:F-box domain-containing protein n=1 Tax=Mycena chlorophos TaxID=658473 RepID=A0A8H6TQB9_MYCCL|nr:hypothetical protein HMN09_00176900 [Mycena chlorophos]